MKKTKLLILTSLLFSTMVACNNGNNDISSSMVENEVHSISIKSTPTKTTYEVGEEIDLEGATIVVVYNNGTNKDVEVTSSMISSIDMSEEGEKTVTIEYEGKKTSFIITVTDSREVCPITFNGETQYIYDGLPKEIEFQIPDGVKYTAEYQKNETYYSSYDNAPSELGTYALVIKTEGNETYKPTTNWFTFSIIENKKEAEVTFGSETVFVYDGESHSPTFEVENNLSYEIEYRYASNEEWCGVDAPSKVGEYILCVKVLATDETRETNRYCTFSIIDSNITKITPTINFEFEAGTSFKVGEAPSYKIIDENGNEITDADVSVIYSNESGYNSSSIPTEVAGYYSIVVTVNSDNKYNSSTNWRTFILVTKDVCSIDFIGQKEYEQGSTDNIEIVVPNGVTYEAYYEKNEVRYSSYEDGLPNEIGEYVLVVEVSENDTYNYTKKWFVFNIVEKNDDNKITPTINFEFDAGTTFKTNEIPSYKIIDESENEITDANVTINYTSDDTGYNSTVFPTESGSYGITVTVNSSDKYNSTSKTTWFRLSTKSQCSIEFVYEGELIFNNNDTRIVSIVVPDGVSYEAHYEKEEKYYSSYEDGLPQEVGTYALVVTTSETNEYDKTSEYIIIRIVED